MLAAIRKDRPLARALALLYLTLSLFVGLAHRAPAIAADGVTALCLSDSSGATAPEYDHTTCDACMITGAPGLLPTAPVMSGAPSSFVVLRAPLLDQRPIRALASLPPPARGPPLSA